MPHINEGLLHAHLDGALGPDEQLQWVKAEAHLEVCDDCRRRLEEAAELRDAASVLLASAAPVRSTPQPAFDELVARAEARRADSASGRDRGGAGGAWWRTPARLAWAASLVIAVGAGWIGRQLVIEHGLDAPRVTAERDVTVSRSEAGEGALLEDTREGAAPDEVGRRRDPDAVAPPSPEAESRFRAEDGGQARRAARPEAAAMQEKAEAEVTADDDADEIRLQATALAAGTARCYAVSPEARDDEEAETPRRLQTLRLAADGTASLRLDGRSMVGFWERAAADSVRLRVTDGVEWRELALIEAEGGVRGDAELEAVDCP